MNFSHSLQFSTEAVRCHGRRLDYHERKYVLSVQTPTNRTSYVRTGLYGAFVEAFKISNGWLYFSHLRTAYFLN